MGPSMPAEGGREDRDARSGSEGDFVAANRAAAAQDDDLAQSLTALSRLSSSRLSLEDLLTRVATYAVQAIPGADGAGLTLIEVGRTDTIVKSEPFVREVDDIQYSLGEGPCITAAATGMTVRSGSLGGDRRWPRFGARVGRLGVHSVLSLPLRTGDEVVGAMNVYAHAKDAFDERAEQLGEVFAVPAAIAVQNAQILAQTQRLATNLQSALTNRAVIDQAIGILMSRTGVTADEAFSRLRELSQREHTKLAEVAAEIVKAAVKRARSRRDGP
ncbi:MAG TPA: GAF and ANTAR domain-containing protein [Nakamurella sp.]